MKKYNRNESANIVEVKNLVISIFEHPEAAYWLKDAIWNAINDNCTIDAFDSDNVRLMMEFTDWNDTKRGKK